MNKEQVKQTLVKASDLEKGKEIALAKEFIAIEEQLTGLKNDLADLATGENKEITVELEII